ncbi:MAG: hypothetical protein AAGD47_15760 [Pseudomonadota bacterium]
MTEKPSLPAAGVLDQLTALTLDRGRPLIAVDADEVLVLLAAHLKQFLARHQIDMRLTEYRLEGTMFPHGEEYPLSFEESIQWIDRFFEEEVLHQQALPGAAAALKSLSAVAQIIVLTNVPAHGGAKRVENLKGLGIPYPVVVNSGGKGAALAWLADRVAAPLVFIDDSPRQIKSAKDAVPDLIAIHFAGAAMVERLIPDCAEADHRVSSWADCDKLICRLLGV